MEGDYYVNYKTGTRILGLNKKILEYNTLIRELFLKTSN